MCRPDYHRESAETIKADRRRAEEIEHALARKFERWGDLDGRGGPARASAAPARPTRGRRRSKCDLHVAPRHARVATLPAGAGHTVYHSRWVRPLAPAPVAGGRPIEQGRHGCPTAAEDDLDLSSLNDEELTLQIQDDLYDGLKREVDGGVQHPARARLDALPRADRGAGRRHDASSASTSATASCSCPRCCSPPTR